MASKALRNIVFSVATVFGAAGLSNCASGGHYHNGHSWNHQHRTCTTVDHGYSSHTHCHSYENSGHHAYDHHYGRRHHFNFKVTVRNPHQYRPSCSMAFNNGQNYVMRWDRYNNTPTKFCIDGKQVQGCFETARGSGQFHCYR